MKNYCFVTDTAKRMKRQTTDWEKILPNHISNKGLAFRIYKEFSELNCKKQTTQLKNGQGT